MHSGELVTLDVNSIFSPDDPDLRGKIIRLEQALMALPDSQKVYLPERNHFSPGVYARELPIPAGTVLVGKIHKYENMNILASGDISVLTEDGIKRLQAPAVIISPPGTKRVGYAHTDTVWITVHGTNERDVEQIERDVLVPSFDDLPGVLDGSVIQTLGV